MNADNAPSWYSNHLGEEETQISTLLLGNPEGVVLWLADWLFGLSKFVRYKPLNLNYVF